MPDPVQKTSFLQKLQSMAGGGRQQQQPQGGQGGQGGPGGGSQQQPNQQQQRDPNDPSQSQQQNNGPSQRPGGGGEGGQSGLDLFAQMFDNPGTSDGPPAFQIDADTLGKARKGFNGLHGLDPAVLEKAKGGDWESQLAIMAHMSGSAYERALDHGSQVTGKYLDVRDGHREKGFDGRVRKAMLGEHLSNKNLPMGARKVMTRIMSSLSAQYPDASTADLEGAAQEMFQEMSSVFNSGDGEQQSGQPGGRREFTDEEWDTFFGSKVPSSQNSQ